MKTSEKTFIDLVNTKFNTNVTIVNHPIKQLELVFPPDIEETAKQKIQRLFEEIFS